MVWGPSTLQFWEGNKFVSTLCFKINFRGLKIQASKLNHRKKQNKKIEINIYMKLIYEDKINFYT